MADNVHPTPDTEWLPEQPDGIKQERPAPEAPSHSALVEKREGRAKLDDQDHPTLTDAVAETLQRLVDSGISPRKHRGRLRGMVMKEMKLDRISERTLSRALKQLGWTSPRRPPPS
jgi:hypothetical protein